MELTRRESELLANVRDVCVFNPIILEDSKIRKIFFGLAELVNPKILAKGRKFEDRKNIVHYIRTDMQTPYGISMLGQQIDYLLRTDIPKETHELSKLEIQNATKRLEENTGQIENTRYLKLQLEERVGELDYILSGYNSFITMPAPFEHASAEARKIGWYFSEFLLYLFTNTVIVNKTLLPSLPDKKLADSLVCEFDNKIIPAFEDYVTRIAEQAAA